MMGTTSKPVFLVVHPTVVDLPEFVAMRGQGHTIVSMADISVVSKVEGGFDAIPLTEVDMILGSNAWCFESRQMYLLDRVIATARARRSSHSRSHTAELKKKRAPKALKECED